MMKFSPIHQCQFICATNEYHSPVPIYRACGVDLSRYYADELEAYVVAGPADSEDAALVERQILDARGGVLPEDWTKVKYHKRNLEMVERMASLSWQ